MAYIDGCHFENMYDIQHALDHGHMLQYSILESVQIYISRFASVIDKRALESIDGAVGIDSILIALKLWHRFVNFV